MGTLGVVEVERPEDGGEHVVGDVRGAALLQTYVVGNAYPGSRGHLRAPKAGNAALLAGQLERRLEPRSARAQEITELVPSLLHVPTA
jgi:hypothetical protein